MTGFQRTKAIIAVFGSSDKASLPLAEAIGFIIAKRKQILLTGGRKPGTESVKERAIKGSMFADSSWPWIGVDRIKQVRSTSSVGSEFVIDTDLGHRRNYLEACLCDAAIGLKGGDGTSSEITFSLFLHKPVALIGGWPKIPLEDPYGTERVLTDMQQRALSLFREVPGNPNHAFDDLINETVPIASEQLPPHEYFALETDDTEALKEPATKIVDWILESLKNPKGSGLMGEFPKFDGYDTVREEYHKWLGIHAV